MTDAAAFLTYDDSIATITLNRPERFNAMDGAAAVTLARLARELKAARRMIASWVASARERTPVWRPSHITRTLSDNSNSSGISELTVTMPRPWAAS